MLIAEENVDISFRGFCIIRNIIEYCKFSAEDIVKRFLMILLIIFFIFLILFFSNAFEILMARSRDTNPANQKLRFISLEILEKLAEDKFIQATGL